MNICAKCKKHTENGSNIVEGGICYQFCKECSVILESFPSSTNIMHIFLTPDERQSQEERNIFEARRRRAKRQSCWS